MNNTMRYIKVFLSLFLLVSVAHSTLPRNNPLPPGEWVEFVPSRCSRFFSMVGLHQLEPVGEFVVVTQELTPQLRQFQGKNVSFIEVFEKDQFQPRQVRRDLHYTTYQSVHGGPELIDPPMVGAFQIVSRDTPFVAETEISPGRYVGTRRIFRNSEGQSFAAYTHPDSQSAEGFFLEVDETGCIIVTNKNGQKIKLQFREGSHFLMSLDETQ